MSAVRGLIDEVADFAEHVVKHGLPRTRRDPAARAVLDTVGVMILGSAQPIRDTVLAVTRQWGASPDCTVIGQRDRMPSASAAFVNGTLAHCMDYDDTHLPSVLHPSACVVPTVLAVAEATGADGPRLLDALAVGTEVCIRLGMAGYDAEQRNSIFFDRGQHATSICGAVGSAVAAAMVLAGDAATIAAAASIAASMASGLIEANRTGGTVKRIQTGWAAHCGVTAAQLAVAGLTGPPTVLEGRFGFFQAFCGDRARPERVTDGLGEHWHSDRMHVKPYPCNHFTHTGIDAALELRRRGVRPDEVRAIELGVPEPVLRTIAEPAAAKAAPATGYAAAFSGPYTVAAALLGGGGLGLYVGDFTDAAAHRAEVVALAGKVTCHADPECTAIFPDQFPARVTVRLADGRTERVARDTNRGGPHRPLTDAELDRKFTLNAATRYDAATAAAIAREIRGLIEAPDARPTMQLLSTHHSGGNS
ncbi:MmgE/PrpD family protein [Nocardia terpenica]|uniref:MmgE/PrpD family protein n=1 Tax=Nocardia terpenica TaxID=455432 RepID=UPI0018957416|nr:MmgE/PrpD family protein [Nocardia terpenica]MBF6063735.1 MmgE/PrpD family protein [Nocardia terpenica]MBF6107111.1 MmgE/PrpD family protein [Nocardia terpenica]MBF6114284.1 MmgE/PrpD family protein [Nocardia terpenica]MBF6121629.1 MmgE/PrpD family protein [Nocardia terpenica]MBF6154044.1 MmgE/PrpD family protein [Nocardia terpenica]